MIKITYDCGERTFDCLKNEEDRRVVLASLMTVREMARFFEGKEASEVAKLIGVPVGRTELETCRSIYRHFHD